MRGSLFIRDLTQIRVKRINQNYPNPTNITHPCELAIVELKKCHWESLMNMLMKLRGLKR